MVSPRTQINSPNTDHSKLSPEDDSLSSSSLFLLPDTAPLTQFIISVIPPTIIPAPQISNIAHLFSTLESKFNQHTAIISLSEAIQLSPSYILCAFLAVSGYAGYNVLKRKGSLVVKLAALVYPGYNVFKVVEELMGATSFHSESSVRTSPKLRHDILHWLSYYLIISTSLVHPSSSLLPSSSRHHRNLPLTVIKLVALYVLQQNNKASLKLYQKILRPFILKALLLSQKLGFSKFSVPSTIKETSDNLAVVKTSATFTDEYENARGIDDTCRSRTGTGNAEGNVEMPLTPQSQSAESLYDAETGIDEISQLRDLNELFNFNRTQLPPSPIDQSRQGTSYSQVDSATSSSNNATTSFSTPLSRTKTNISNSKNRAYTTANVSKSSSSSPSPHTNAITTPSTRKQRKQQSRDLSNSSHYMKREIDNQSTLHGRSSSAELFADVDS